MKSIRLNPMFLAPQVDGPASPFFRPFPGPDAQEDHESHQALGVLGLSACFGDRDVRAQLDDRAN